MKNRVGPIVVGDDFFDREEEIPRLMELIDVGDHVSLVAQRRIGKSSLLKETARRLEGRFLCLYVDLQDCAEGADAIVVLTMAARDHTRLWTKVQSTFSNVLGAVDSIGSDELQLRLRNGLVGDWRVKGDRVLADLAGSDIPVVLMFDELPVLLVRLLRDRDGNPRSGGREQADHLLSWLRRGAIAHTGRLRIVVTGSIGLEPIARQVGLSGALNVYRPLAIGAWTPSVAMAALRSLAKAKSLGLSEDAAGAVVELLGSCVPYHVQLFFSQIEEDARRHKRASVSALDVERVYNSRMLSAHGHAELAHMEERLRLLVPPETLPLTLNLLTEAAVVGSLTVEAARRLALDDLPPGANIDETLRHVFGVLEHDGYLERAHDGHRRFLSRLLKDWWARRFGEFYVPASKRSAS